MAFHAITKRVVHPLIDAHDPTLVPQMKLFLLIEQNIIFVQNFCV